MNRKKRVLWLTIAVGLVLILSVTAIYIIFPTPLIIVDVGVRNAWLACRDTDEAGLYDCYVQNALVTNHANVCFLLGPALDDHCMQEFYERSNDPRVCSQIMKPGVRANCEQYYQTKLIQLLSTFAIDLQGVDLVFGCDVADYNPASLKAFQKAGYTVEARIEQPVGTKARYCYDLVLTRERYVALNKLTVCSTN